MNGTTLETVETDTFVGSGTCGEVFAVENQEQSLLLKKFNSMAIDRRLMEQSYLRLEAMPPVENENPGLAKVYDFKFDSPPYAILMERIEGATLDRSSSMKEGTAWDLIRELSETLGHLHKHGIFHGHLHPGNLILADRAEKIRIVATDFATGMVGDVHHIDLGESTWFAAPEQLLSGGGDWENGTVQRWDVYSFGLVAYYLINGHLPRGEKYIKHWKRDCESSGGRPVGIDYHAFVDEVLGHPKVSWGMSLGVSREFKLYREVIDRCLELDPKKRPVDLREVRNQFRSLANQFALEDAEDRVLREKRKQKAKLFGARAMALCLGCSFLGATYFLIDYLKQTYFFQNKVSELDQVVLSQKAHITHLDERWAETVTDLKSSREAADSFFQRMAQGDNAGGSGVAGLREEDLEKSKTYYEKILFEVDDDRAHALERARAIHSLAHIERKIGERTEALQHFREAIEKFKEIESNHPKSSDTFVDIQMRLADSFENVSSLVDHDIGAEALSALESASRHFSTLLELEPDREEIVRRFAGTSFKLGSAYDAHRRFEDAVQAYSKSADLVAALDEGSPDLVELTGKLQFRAAHSLREIDRVDESINAHVASMETLEKLRHVNGFDPLQRIQLASSYIELGELFTQRDATEEDLDQLYNEALRLLSSLNSENPEDVEVSTLLCRSLLHLGTIERNGGRWTTGYRLAVQGIEALKKSLEANPDHLPGSIFLAEARLAHMKFFDSDQEAAIKIAELGVETAKTAAELLKKGVREPVRSQYRDELRQIFQQYGDAYSGMGETVMAQQCYDQASLKVTSLPSKDEFIE